MINHGEFAPWVPDPTPLSPVERHSCYSFDNRLDIVGTLSQNIQKRWDLWRLDIRNSCCVSRGFGWDCSIQNFGGMDWEEMRHGQDPHCEMNVHNPYTYVYIIHIYNYIYIIVGYIYIYYIILYYITLHYIILYYILYPHVHTFSYRGQSQQRVPLCQRLRRHSLHLLLPERSIWVWPWRISPGIMGGLYTHSKK